MANANLRFYSTAGNTISGLALGTIISGQVSFTTELILYNNFNGVSAVDDATDTLVAVRNVATPAGDDPVAEGWVYAKSIGIENPDGVDNFFDDNQSLYTRLSDTQVLEVGDIPDNCGRHIFFQVQPPATATPQADIELRLIAGAGPIFDPLPQYFNRAFGDGIVDQIVYQIFPASVTRKAGAWSDMLMRVGGAYTGGDAKTYRINVVSGGSFGVATYRCSTDGGSTWSNTLTSGTTTFTDAKTSGNVDEGVDIKWSSAAGATLVANDTWDFDVDIEPFAFHAGASNALTGYIGWGDALVYNNRIRPRSVGAVTGLSPSQQTYIFLNADGDFQQYTTTTPQVGKLLMGWFTTNATHVTSHGKLAPQVTLGLDLFDDFAPIFPSIQGLTWTLYKGRYRRFNQVITIPTTGYTTSLTLTANTWNYLQIDPYNDVILRDSYYREDYPPLFRILTGGTYVDEWHDDRTRIGVPVLEVNVVSTVSSVATGTSTTFSINNVGIRTLMRELAVTPYPSGTGYTFTFYRESGLTTREYQAGTLSGIYSDYFQWYHENNNRDNKIWGIVENQTGAGTTFTFSFVGERLA